jgi:hypothetical protein
MSESAPPVVHCPKCRRLVSWGRKTGICSLRCVLNLMHPITRKPKVLEPAAV